MFTGTAGRVKCSPGREGIARAASVTGSVGMALMFAGVAGCASGKPATSASASPASSVSVSASASASSTADDWPTLNGINTKVAADIDQIRSARTPTAVSAAVTTGESDLYLDFYRQVGMTPPSTLQAAQDALAERGLCRQRYGEQGSRGQVPGVAIFVRCDALRCGVYCAAL